eukprot:TRINITY_DN1699_c1_g1_i1.p1 TRINITY_DN1699_c1_g1~~TRINITY_DN1699_c1_g1_i1.p1  ORF type:complete len:400 (-),score=90.39 TRINITY_DN1699_c1_g1_i1:10-1209(-)
MKSNITILGQINAGKSTTVNQIIKSSNPILRARIERDEILNMRSNFDEVLMSRDIEDGSIRMLLSDRFLLIDTPEIDQSLDDVVKGAGLADFGVIVIDMEKESQNEHTVVKVDRTTRDFIHIFGGFGVRELLVLLNKMDCVEYSQEVFEEYKTNFMRYISPFKYWDDVLFVPVSSVTGENISEKSDNMRWYFGDTFFEIIESCTSPEQSDTEAPLLLSIIDVNISTGNQIVTAYIEQGSMCASQDIISHYTSSTIEQILDLDKNPITSASSGSVVDITLDPINMKIQPGEFFSTDLAEISTFKSFTAEIHLFGLLEEIYTGTVCDVYFKTQKISCTFDSLIETTYPKRDKDPLFLRTGEKAIVTFTCTTDLLVKTANPQFLISKGISINGTGTILEYTN